MSMKKEVSYVSLVALLIPCLALVTGCARYKSRPVEQLVTDSSPVHDDEDSISYAYRVFNVDDCKKYLDRDVISKGYQPIHVTFTNNSNHTLNFSLKGFNMPCVPAYEVANTVHTSTTKRAVGYGVAGLFVWPLLIPAVVDGVGSHEANKKLDDDFSHKTLQDQLISPRSTINGLIFIVANNFTAPLEMTVTDVATQEKFVLAPKKARLRI